MLRFVLVLFVVYQLYTLPSQTSAIANGTGGGVLAIVALIIFIIIWAIRHDDDTSIQPFSTLLW